jgi:Na+/melibiose symporter-like transporter
MLLGIFVYDPSWPRFVVLAFAGLSGVGYGVADLMPWSMLGDVIDEDDLQSGERSEGLYAGLFTFLRKLGGALGVALAGAVLDAAGLVRGGGGQSEAALLAIRCLTGIVPIVCLLIAGWIALRYPLGLERHAEIRRMLEERREEGAEASGG